MAPHRYAISSGQCSRASRFFLRGSVRHPPSNNLFAGPLYRLQPSTTTPFGGHTSKSDRHCLVHGKLADALAERNVDPRPLMLKALTVRSGPSISQEFESRPRNVA